MSSPQRSQLLHSLCTWKEKAVVRRAQVSALQKRIVELTQSRDAWKVNAQTWQRKVGTLQAENARLTTRKVRPEKKSVPHAISILSRRFKHSLP